MSGSEALWIGHRGIRLPADAAGREPATALGLLRRIPSRGHAARAGRIGPAVRSALTVGLVLAGCATTPEPGATVHRGLPPEKWPAFVEAFRQALRERDADALVRFVDFPDRMEEEFFRLNLPERPPGGEKPRVEIPYVQAISPDRCLVCVLAPDGIPPLAPRKNLLMRFTFQQKGGRSVTSGFGTLRDAVAAEQLAPQDFGRWKAVERLAAIRFGPLEPAVWIAEARAQFEALEVLASPPYRLLDREEVEASRALLGLLEEGPTKTREDLARAMTGALPHSFLGARGDPLAFYLEAEDGEPGIRLRIADSNEVYLVEPLPVLHDRAVAGGAPTEGPVEGRTRVEIGLTPWGSEILRGIAEKTHGKRLVLVVDGEPIGVFPVPRRPSAKLGGSVITKKVGALVEAAKAYDRGARMLLKRLRRMREGS